MYIMYMYAVCTVVEMHVCVHAHCMLNLWHLYTDGGVSMSSQGCLIGEPCSYIVCSMQLPYTCMYDYVFAADGYAFVMFLCFVRVFTSMMPHWSLDEHCSAQYLWWWDTNSLRGLLLSKRKCYLRKGLLSLPTFQSKFAVSSVSELAIAANHKCVLIVK